MIRREGAEQKFVAQGRAGDLFRRAGGARTVSARSTSPSARCFGVTKPAGLELIEIAPGIDLETGYSRPDAVSA